MRVATVIRIVQGPVKSCVARKGRVQCVIMYEHVGLDLATQTLNEGDLEQLADAHRFTTPHEAAAYIIETLFHKTFLAATSAANGRAYDGGQLPLTSGCGQMESASVAGRETFSRSGSSPGAYASRSPVRILHAKTGLLDLPASSVAQRNVSHFLRHKAETIKRQTASPFLRALASNVLRHRQPALEAEPMSEMVRGKAAGLWVRSAAADVDTVPETPVQERPPEWSEVYEMLNIEKATQVISAVSEYTDKTIDSAAAEQLSRTRDVGEKEEKKENFHRFTDLRDHHDFLNSSVPSAEEEEHNVSQVSSRPLSAAGVTVLNFSGNRATAGPPVTPFFRRSTDLCTISSNDAWSDRRWLQRLSLVQSLRPRSRVFDDCVCGLYDLHATLKRYA